MIGDNDVAPEDLRSFARNVKQKKRTAKKNSKHAEKQKRESTKRRLQKFDNWVWASSFLPEKSRIRCLIDSYSYHSGTCSLRPPKIRELTGAKTLYAVNQVMKEDVAKGRYRWDPYGHLQRALDDKDEFERIRVKEDLDVLSGAIRVIRRMSTKAKNGSPQISNLKLANELRPRARQRTGVDQPTCTEEAVRKLKPRLEELGFTIIIGRKSEPTTYSHPMLDKTKTNAKTADAADAADAANPNKPGKPADTSQPPKPTAKQYRGRNCEVKVNGQWHPAYVKGTADDGERMEIIIDDSGERVYRSPDDPTFRLIRLPGEWQSRYS